MSDLNDNNMVSIIYLKKLLPFSMNMERACPGVSGGWGEVNETIFASLRDFLS